MIANDNKLANKVKQILIDHGLENNFDKTKIDLWQTEHYSEQLQQKLAEFIDLLGTHQPSNEANRTAQRVLKLFIQDRFSGLDYNNFPKITLAKNEFNYTNPVIANDVPLLTTCEHHLVTIKGKALIAYQPKNHLIGLNKLNLILDFFARRPQLQERLTKQVYFTLKEILQTEDIAIAINAIHDCLCIEGIYDKQTFHSTYEISGVFANDPALKAKILNFCNY